MYILGLVDMGYRGVLRSEIYSSFMVSKNV